MIKKIWDAIHFGRFEGQWRNSPPEDTASSSVLLGKTLFYETRVEKNGADWKLVTENGGYAGRFAFWMALPIYLIFAIGIAFGATSIFHLAFFELIFISVFGVLNGFAIHKLAQQPGYGIETLSHRQISSV